MAIDQRLVWGGIAVGGAGIAVYMYRKNKKQQAATTAAASQTGYGYGMPTYAYGYGQTYSPYGYGFGPFGLGAYGGQGDYGYGYYGAGSGVPVGVPQQATTNAQWSEAAVSALTAVGYDGQSVLAALGIYLTGGGLTQDQSGIISAAIAAEGYPPVSGPNGFPPQMNVGGGGGTGQGSGGTTGGGTSGGGGVTGGGVGGTGGGGGGTRTTGGRITGLTGTATRNSINATWARTNAPDGYDVIVRDLSAHDEVAHQTVNAPHFTARGLKPKTTYNIGVQALPGGPGANIHVRTK